MTFSQLCATNQYGGDPRLYKLLLILFYHDEDKHGDQDIQAAFDLDLLSKLTGKKESKCDMNIAENDEGRLYFKGYIDCDFIRQLNVVLHMWNKMCFFPVNFLPIQGFNDETNGIVHTINQLTPTIVQLFEALKQANTSHDSLKSLAKDLILGLGPRGILTMLGQRKTPGSQDIAWPDVNELKQSFNKPHTVLTPEQQARQRNPASKLTVGARALTKHCHRSSEGFWGMFRGSEEKKNSDANEKLDQILKDCVWVNVHVITHSEIIVECRIQEGYGMRWTGSGNFRGFLEPQMADGHQKGWIH